MRPQRPRVIAVDFDGTICKNAWPDIGEPNTELIETLIAWRKLGTQIILWTRREGDYLQQAVDWCKEHGLEFDAVNDNTKAQKQYFGNNPRKVGADYYIDDKNAVFYKIGPKPEILHP